MSTATTVRWSTPAQCLERLQQADRVMQGLSREQRALFDISVIAEQRDNGLAACIAGYCGLDPWFQSQGFTTTISPKAKRHRGTVSIYPGNFFGTDTPFFQCCYGSEFAHRKPTFDDAVAVLRKEIAQFSTLI